MSSNVIEVRDKRLHKIRDVLEAVNSDDPDPRAIEQLKEWLSTSPDLWRLFADVDRSVQSKIIERLHGSKLGEISAEKGVELTRYNLGYDHAPQLEQLLIEHAVTCWLRLQYVGWHYDQVTSESIPLARADYWERRLSAAQRRFLRAAETMARVRKITRQTPALQLNIAIDGGQQVNVVQ